MILFLIEHIYIHILKYVCLNVYEITLIIPFRVKGLDIRIFILKRSFKHLRLFSGTI